MHSEVERLRQRLHQGTSTNHAPVSGTSVHEEKREESHFVDGQQVYRKNEEKRYEDGRLVHDTSNVEGEKRDEGTAHQGAVRYGIGAQNRQNSYTSTYTNENRRPTQYTAPVSTSYRASYWRPGDRSRARNRNSYSQSSTHSSAANQPITPGSTYRANSAGIRGTPSRSVHVRPNRVRTEVMRPAYRASYTPSARSSHRTRVSLSQGTPSPITSQVSSTLNRRQYTSSSGYQTPVIETPTVSQSSSRSEESQFQSSYSNKPQNTGVNYGASSSYGANTYHEQNTESPGVISNSDSRRLSSASSQQFSTSYGGSSYNRPTEAPANAQTTSRITDRYSVPYSQRSQSYQPSRFANYSAWSHWKKDSENSPRPSISTRTSSYSHQQNSNTYPVGQSHPQTRGHPSGGSSIGSQEPEVITFRPGFLYNDNRVDEGRSDGNHESSISRVSQYDKSSSNYPSSTLYSSQTGRTSGSSYSSGSSYNSNSQRTADGAIGTSPGSQVDLSILVDVGEGDSVKISKGGSLETMETNKKRFDISPLVDGAVGLSEVDNEINTDYNSNTGASSSMSQYDYIHSRGSNYDNNLVPVVGSTYGTTKITNRTTNTVTAHVQPLVSSYKLETRTSRRYLNGKLVSETKFNRYYENGVLVHENQTERSRDEMQTEGINVSLLDLSVSDMKQYGVMESEAVPMAHSQRFELREEKEFVDGDQIYQSTHEKHFQDGELVHEDHNEKNREELVALGANVNDNSIYSSGLYHQGSNARQGYLSGGSRGRLGNSHRTGVDETVRISVSPISRTHKTQIRQEKEYRDGQQVYDLKHERQFEDGHLVHEDLSEKGPENFEVSGHRDALYDIISGRSLATATDRKYNSRPYTTQYAQNSLDSSNTQRVIESGISSSSNRESESRQVQGNIGSNLLSSGHLTSVIGSGGIESINTMNRPVSSEGKDSYSSNSISSSSSGNIITGTSGDRQASGGGYYTSVGRSGSGYGGANMQPSDSISSGYTSGSANYDMDSSRSGASYGNSEFSSTGSFGAHREGYNPGQSVSHRREMEVEEHYENGQLVSGREEDKSWKNENLINHEERRYGEVSY